MSILVKASITSKDDIVVSLERYSEGIDENLTKYLVYELSAVEGDKKEIEKGSQLWKIDMTLPYPQSQISGDLTLRVKDRHSGDLTTSRLSVQQEGNVPFFHPEPQSVVAFIGEMVFVNSRARGSEPLIVSILILTNDSNQLITLTHNLSVL